MKGMLFDDNGDLMITKGSLIVGDSSGQLIESVLITNRGEFKENPLIGAEACKLKNGNIDPIWCGDTKIMLKACGVEVDKVYMNEEGVIIK